MTDDPLSTLLASYEAEQDPLVKMKIGHDIAVYYYFKLSKYEEAIQYDLQVLKIAEELHKEREASTICNLLGASYRNLLMMDEAKEILQHSISIGEKLQDCSLQHRPYIDLGGVYLNTYNHSLALDCFVNALKISEKLGDSEVIALANTCIGRTYSEIGEYNKAVSYIRKALKILPIDNWQIFVCYQNIANAYCYLNDHYLAIGYLKKAIPLYEKVHSRLGVAETYCKIGEIYNKIQKKDKAMEYALKAKNYLSENNIENKEIEAQIYLLFITLFSTNDDIEETEKYIQKFLDLKVTMFNRLHAFYTLVVPFYEKQQKMDLAFAYLRKYNEVNKHILGEEMQKDMAIKTANFEYEREKQSAEILRQKNEELLKLHEEKDNLMNTISHDLKNYLGATQQALDIFALKEKEMSENKYIKIVTTSTARSLNLVKEILYSTKVAASADALNLQTVDISSVIAENEETLHLRASKKGINVVFQYAPEPLLVQLDSEKWHRVFENLTTNAIKFTSAGKDIRISTKREGDFALISIADSGIGIAPENISKLFTPFSGVGRKGTDGEESTGLGLSIVKKLVELHGGEIEVSSEVGHGTEFVVKLRIIRC